MLSIFNLSGGTAQSGRSHCSIQAEPLLNFAGRADFAERRTQPETKSAIEQVIDVFNDYIRTSTHFELLWSDKVGYIYISIDNVQGSIGDTGCCVVNCGEELFDKLVWELAVDIMEEVGHTIDPTEATLLERREIERRIHPYLEQLPTYQDRLQRVFTREKD